MNIPDGAVESAARNLASHNEFAFDAWPDHYRERARKALEAAAPHLKADAWDEGQKSGMRHTDRLVAAAKIGRPDLPGPLSPNPYRAALTATEATK